MLPDYIRKAVPNPRANRAPWYVNTAPTYAGIFLWVAFYQQLAQGSIPHAGPGLILLALLIAGLLSFGLYYYAPAMLGMKTGFPLYVVGSSTFGTLGGYAMPGLFMGVLQVGWFAVSTSLATKFILQGIGLNPAPGTAAFVVVAVIWGYTMAWIGAKGIHYVARVALYLNVISFLMVLTVFVNTMGGIPSYTVPDPNPSQAMLFLIQAVIGFFATAGAAGADFGMNSRDERDVRLGGFVGITLAILYAGGLPILSVMGARAHNAHLQSLEFGSVIAALGGFLPTAMFFLFAIASIPSACFCAFIAGNSFATMIPGVKRIASTMAGVTVAILLAVTGVADNLISFFGFIGASFGPICGAIAADYLLSGKRWAGPRRGINWAGYAAWAIGFVVGMLPVQPAVVYSFLTGLVVYAVAAKLGFEPRPVSLDTERAVAR
ncbi:MAG TPA: cytosine permease [Bryobacteraceae bacterium]|nr:cytosine permease [Bryobacteraceae bacterium]